MEERIVEEPLEGVRQRQEREPLVVGADVQDRENGQEVGDEVAVGQHHALGFARGAGGVDERGEIVGIDLRRRWRIAAAAEKGFEFVHPDHVGNDALDLGCLLTVPDDDHLGPGVLEDVGAVLGKQRRVDRHVDGAEVVACPIGHRPFEAVVGEDGDAVAVADPQRGQPGGTGFHLVGDLVGGDGLPGLPDLAPVAVGSGMALEALREEFVEGRRIHVRLVCSRKVCGVQATGVR